MAGGLRVKDNKYSSNRLWPRARLGEAKAKHPCVEALERVHIVRERISRNISLIYRLLRVYLVDMNEDLHQSPTSHCKTVVRDAVGRSTSQSSRPRG